MPANKDENGFEKFVGSYNLLASNEFSEAMIPFADILHKYREALIGAGFTPDDALFLTAQFQNGIFQKR